MRRTAALLMVPASLLLAASPAFADEAETKPAETGVVEPAYEGDVSVNFSRAVVDGKDAYRIPRDVPVTLVLDVYNPNEDAVTDILIDLDNRPDEIRWTKGKASIDRLDGFASAQVEVEIIILSRVDCLDDDSAEGTISSSRGSSPAKLWLPVACPGPRLYQSRVEYRGGDGDDVPEAGERLEVWVTYGNWGADPATNVRGTLTIDSEHVRVVEGSAAWPTIPAADPSARAEASSEGTQLTPFIIEIDADAPASDGGCGWDGGPGPVTIGDAPAPSAGGGTSPGAADEPGAADTGTSPGAADEPGTAGDDPATREAPAPMSPEEEERYEQPDPSVAFEGKLHLVTAETEMDDVIGNMYVCMYATDGAKGGAVTADETGQLGAPEAGGLGADTDLTAAGAEDTATSTGSSALVAAFLAGIATAAWFVMRRKLFAR